MHRTDHEKYWFTEAALAKPDSVGGPANLCCNPLRSYDCLAMNPASQQPVLHAYLGVTTSHGDLHHVGELLGSCPSSGGPTASLDHVQVSTLYILRRACVPVAAVVSLLA
jgi:hypothetical protein